MRRVVIRRARVVRVVLRGLRQRREGYRKASWTLLR
jgi:hypothetical protein